MSHIADRASTPHVADDAPQGLSRRAVVRTGAHMAWAVPAVSLVTAAPALAVSHGEPRLRISSFSASGGRKKTQIAMGPVVNRGQGDAGQITAVVSLPARLDNCEIDGDVSKGWTLAGGKKGNTLTFVSNDGNVKAGERTKALSFSVSHDRVKMPKGTATVAVSGNGASDTDSDKL